MTIGEKCAYLKGLAEGRELDVTKTEGKLIAELISIVGEMAEELDELRDELDTANEYCEELDHDLGEIEEMVLELCEDDEDGYYDDELECDGVCEGCSGCDDEDDDDEFENMRCAICAKCGDTVCFDEDMEIENIVCPSCGTALSESFDED